MSLRKKLDGQAEEYQATEAMRKIGGHWEDAYAKKLLGSEMERYYNRLKNPGEEGSECPSWIENMATWIAIAVVDSEGNRAFDPDTYDEEKGVYPDVEALKDYPFEMLTEAHDAVLKINEAEAESDDELEKNS